MQEQVRTKGIADHMSLLMPEMALQVIHNGLNLLIKWQCPEITTCLTPSHIEASVHQTLA